jgi:ParB family chromosome partitioning protein
MNGKEKRNLGRGLSALLGEGAEPAPPRAARQLAVDKLEPSPLQPRRRFDPEELESLAASIRANGILQPILVRRHPAKADRHEIVAGERRWRAAQLAGLHEVPVLERAFADREVLEIALVENVQRRDLSALEEAEGYQRLIAEFGRSQEDLAQEIGKSRVHVANTLRLLKLPEEAKALLAEGSITAGHGRALLAAADPVALARRVVAEDLSVRQTEALAAERAAPRRAPKTPAPKDADTRALERDLANALGLEVEIAHAGSGGRVTIRYRSLEQLDEVVRRLNG